MAFIQFLKIFYDGFKIFHIPCYKAAKLFSGELLAGKFQFLHFLMGKSYVFEFHLYNNLANDDVF